MNYTFKKLLFDSYVYLISVAIYYSVITFSEELEFDEYVKSGAS
jgi:hypothetical protein